ncbi:MAG: FtsQ-type POTRA domain-containing protein [Deltaproteobacteria bacterium]|nr:FtsQ-type POTRA domain-containing protein [Deltaproteobacteria bacterium]
MLVKKKKKRAKKNYYKNSGAKKRAGILISVGGVLKISSLFVAVVLMSFAFIFGYDLLTQSDFFSAAKITVTDFDRLSRQQVIDHANVYPGKNIFSINLTTTRKRLLAHPWIREAEVSREIPSGLAIRVKEHVPLAIIDMNHRFLIDRSGIIFKEWDEGDPADLPVIAGLNISDLKVGNGPFSRSFSAIMSVLKLGQANGSTIPIERISKIEVDRDIGLTIQVKDKMGKIHLGYNDYPSKYKILAKVFVYFQNNSGSLTFRSIDLNNPNRIVVNMDTKASPAMGQKEV